MQLKNKYHYHQHQTVQNDLNWVTAKLNSSCLFILARIHICCILGLCFNVSWDKENVVFLPAPIIVMINYKHVIAQYPEQGRLHFK